MARQDHLSHLHFAYAGIGADQNAVTLMEIHFVYGMIKERF
jgi:hypothetical protein